MDDIDRIFKEKEAYEKLYDKELTKRLKLQFEYDELKDFTNKLQATKDRLDKYDRKNQLKIDKAIKELFELKDLIYKPETREINFDVQNKITSIIKTLGSDKE